MTSVQQLYQQFHYQPVRDLGWTYLSPPLLHNLPGSDARIWSYGKSHRDPAWLAALDQNPEPLLRELAKSKSTRLGIYYENLLRFIWQQDPRIHLLAHNMQVQMPDIGTIKGSTQGAFDFLLRNGDEFWHIESAVKFYLGVPDGSAGPSRWQQWIGPDCNDRLDIKLNHLREHQLALSTDQHAQKKLTELAGGAKTWHRGLCMQGYFFYPARQVMAAPVASNPEHLRGDWWHLQGFLEHCTSGYWLVLPRDRWLSPAQTSDIHQLYSGDNLREILQHWIAGRQKPQLLAVMQKEGEIWVESARSFVVPDHWPWTDLPSRKT